MAHAGTLEGAGINSGNALSVAKTSLSESKNTNLIARSKDNDVFTGAKVQRKFEIAKEKEDNISFMSAIGMLQKVGQFSKIVELS